VALAQAVALKMGVPPSQLEAVMLQPTPDDFLRFKALAGVPLNVLQGRFGLLKYLNRLVTPLLNYVDLTDGLHDVAPPPHDDDAAAAALVLPPSHHAPNGARRPVPGASAPVAHPSSSAEDSAQSNKPAPRAASLPQQQQQQQRALSSVADLSMSRIIHRLKGIYFTETKMSVLQALLKINATGVGKQQVLLHRLKASRAREDPKTDPHGLRSMFGQLFTCLRKTSFKRYRKAARSNQLWNVDFLGEGSIDVGGPYREAITLACADLMSDATPLFLPSPNRVNSVGLNREKFIVNPAATSPLALQMYTFVGALFGIALRTSYTLSLDLPSVVWKHVLAEPVDRSDLEAVDHLCLQALEVIRGTSREEFSEMSDETFTTMLSDGTRVELVEGGASTPVTFANKDEFVARVIRARLYECETQARAMRKGFNDVVPLGMLSMFSWREVERLVCGSPEVDVDALKRHTTYNGNLTATSPVVCMLFKALKSFTNEERQLFLRFVWGRNRLPSHDSEWQQHFVINTLRSSNTTDPTASDQLLPVAHTCFFTIDLPDYSSYDILRSKLLFAIVNCQAIDTDFNPNASSISAWMED